jgi:multicomponent Na+:H+ antiporter subunit F
MLQTLTWLFILPVLTVAVALAFVRLVRGPSLPDRIVALDLIGVLSIGVIAVYAIASGETVYLDVAAVVALISFLGTIAFAYYVEKRV